MAKENIKKINDSSFMTWQDFVFPALYIIFLLILGYFIWKLLSPFIALALGGIIAYIHYLRNFFKEKDN